MASRASPLLEENDIDVEAIASAACEDEALLNALLDEVSPQSRNSKRRCNSLRVLKKMGETAPASLYKRWDYLEALLRSSNEPSRYIAADILPLLAGVDREGRWDGILDDYVALTRAPNLPLAGHAVLGLGLLAGARPEYRGRVTTALLSLDKARIREERKALLKAYAIESFGMYFGEAGEKNAILCFVRGQLKSKSPKGRKSAELFLKKHGKRHWPLPG
jgi:hypothetical protein